MPLTRATDARRARAEGIAPPSEARTVTGDALDPTWSTHDCPARPSGAMVPAPAVAAPLAARRRAPISREGTPMATSLYDLSVPTFLQTVGAVAGFLEKAAGHCAATGTDPDDLVNARLYPDMAPFHFQIECVANHSLSSLEAIRVGAVPFAALQAKIARAEAALQAFTPDEVDGWSGKALDQQIGPRRLAFASESYILSFALPHFHFHAVTAYDILRLGGVPLGKRDYEGRLRTTLAAHSDP
ncbi:DUF1993 domain-containing protein [Sphingomonas sp. RT2P30]|uniref:DUF1993 domain-containing protein n=1 Tax=Parasphingomonas halimpatiens TaxID=3096162 RepID=UPI002FCA02EE